MNVLVVASFSFTTRCSSARAASSFCSSVPSSIIAAKGSIAPSSTIATRLKSLS
ncbi:hypothetical protein PF003_g36427 [Phytophthora fragariae]|nr:hypothetical protein PF003_g36427 [Phytophthora fragariae]